MVQDQHNNSNNQSSNGGLRRVCSLSDLTKQGSGRRMLPAPPLTGTNDEYSKVSNSANPGQRRIFKLLFSTIQLLWDVETKCL